MLKTQAGEKTDLKLQKSIYRLVIVIKLWLLYCRNSLKALGCVLSLYTQCFMFGCNMMQIIFIDN